MSRAIRAEFVVDRFQLDLDFRTRRSTPNVLVVCWNHFNLNNNRRKKSPLSKSDLATTLIASVVEQSCRWFKVMPFEIAGDDCGASNIVDRDHDDANVPDRVSLPRLTVEYCHLFVHYVASSFVSSPDCFLLYSLIVQQL